MEDRLAYSGHCELVNQPQLSNAYPRLHARTRSALTNVSLRWVWDSSPQRERSVRRYQHRVSSRTLSELYIVVEILYEFPTRQSVPITGLTTKPDLWEGTARFAYDPCWRFAWASVLWRTVMGRLNAGHVPAVLSRGSGVAAGALGSWGGAANGGRRAGRWLVARRGSGAIARRRCSGFRRRRAGRSRS